MARYDLLTLEYALCNPTAIYIWLYHSRLLPMLGRSGFVMWSLFQKTEPFLAIGVVFGGRAISGGEPMFEAAADVLSLAF